MAPPPWVLISPTGLTHFVRDEADLKALPSRTLEIEGDKLDEFREQRCVQSAWRIW